MNWSFFYMDRIPRKSLQMHSFTHKSLLLMATTLLWAWQVSQPLLDTILPWVSINDKFSVLISEIVSQYVCIPTLLCFYSLFYVSAGNKLSFRQTLYFLSFATILASGHGIHMACVTIQLQLEPPDGIYSLVDFLHERYSHNVFLFGLYGMLLLVVLAEKEFVHTEQTSPAEPKNGNICNGEVKRDKLKGKTEIESWEPNAAVTVMSRWVWPVVMALHFSIFAQQTSTEMITTFFYFTILSVLILIRQQFSSSTAQSFWKLCNSDLVVLGTLGKASVVGLAVLVLH